MHNVHQAALWAFKMSKCTIFLLSTLPFRRCFGLLSLFPNKVVMLSLDQLILSTRMTNDNIKRSRVVTEYFRFISLVKLHINNLLNYLKSREVKLTLNILFTSHIFKKSFKNLWNNSQHFSTMFHSQKFS